MNKLVIQFMIVILQLLIDISFMIPDTNKYTRHGAHRLIAEPKKELTK